MNIQEKLLKIQTELKCNKGQYNSFGKYSYRSCEDIKEAVKPLLAEVKAILVVDQKIELIGERYYITSTASLIDTETNDRISATASAREDLTLKGMSESQVSGSAGSYSAKYALNNLLALDDMKDPDNFDNKTGKNASASKPNRTPVQQPVKAPTQQPPQQSEHKKAATKEEALKMHVPGKYADKTIGELMEGNINYLKWVVNSSQTVPDVVKQNIKLAIGE